MFDSQVFISCPEITVFRNTLEGLGGGGGLVVISASLFLGVHIIMSISRSVYTVWYFLSDYVNQICDLLVQEH